MKERYQNLRVGDVVKLRTYVFNSFPANASEVQQVEIYRLFATDTATDNPYGKVLVETIDAADITRDDDGQYSIELTLSGPTYTIDRYSDEWTFVFEDTMPAGVFAGSFTVYPNAWFVDTHPIVHDFEFNFSPNKIVKGSKRYIQIEISPSVPRGSEKQKYYENLISAGELYVSIEQKCGNCVPEEEDLRLIVDRELVETRDHCVGYFFLDTGETSDFDCGVYHIWFELNLGPNVFISDKQPFQVFA